jgi:polyphosphate kinase
MVEVAEVAAEAAPAEEPRYFTRELSLLQWDERVLNQARRGAHPLLERVKFLAFSDLNNDEFLTIHFAGSWSGGRRAATS